MHYPAITRKISNYQISLQERSFRSNFNAAFQKTFRHQSTRKQTRRHPFGGSFIDERFKPQNKTDPDEYGSYQFWDDE
jgi:hypothetical protein